VIKLSSTITTQIRWRLGLVVARCMVSVNEVTLRRARLVLGWVTVCGLWPATEANSAFYLYWDGKWIPAKVWWRSASGE